MVKTVIVTAVCPSCLLFGHWPALGDCCYGNRLIFPVVLIPGVDAAGCAGGAALGGGGVDRQAAKTGLRHHGGLAGGGRARHGAPGAVSVCQQACAASASPHAAVFEAVNGCQCASGCARQLGIVASMQRQVTVDISLARKLRSMLRRPPACIWRRRSSPACAP